MIRVAFVKLDRNGNKVIEWEEWVAVDQEPDARKRFDAMDKNTDSKITFFEFSESARRTTNVEKTFSELDLDKDRALSPDEHEGLPHFKILSVRF